MKSLLYALRTYSLDITTAIFALLLTFVTYRFQQNAISFLLISVGIIFLSLIIIIYLRARERDFYYVPLMWRIEESDWIGQGRFEYVKSQRCYRVTDSESGHIFPKALSWQNYTVAFDFKIVSGCLGVVVRAINLSNCIMFQIREGDIRPHVRVNGGWKAWEPDETGFRFKENLSLDKWHRCILICEKKTVHIKIAEKQNILFDREWTIPSGIMFFSFKNDKQESSTMFPLIADYGTIGFRNFGTEEAFVRDLLLEKI